MPTYAKAVLTLFCTCIIFLWNTSFLIYGSKSKKYFIPVVRIKQKGTEISSNGEAIISQFGHTVEMGSAPLAPDLPSIVIWATIAFMFIGGIWFKYPQEK